MKIFKKVNDFFYFIMFMGVVMSSSVVAVPFYGVDIDIYQVGVDVRVNDIPIYFDEEKGQLKVEIPTPENIVDGLNSLSVQVVRPYDGDDRVKSFDENAYISLSLFEQKSPGEEKVIHLSFNLKLNEKGDFYFSEIFSSGKKAVEQVRVDNDGSGVFKISDVLKSSFPRWKWQDGKPIENKETTYDSLMSVYKDLHDAMKSKDVKKVKGFYSQRANEISIAYGLSGEDDGHKKLSTGKDMFDLSLELYDFKSDNVFLEVFGGGKLARIRDKNNVQPIFFYDPKAGLLHLYKFAFYLDENEKWIMIR